MDDAESLDTLLKQSVAKSSMADIDKSLDLLIATANLILRSGIQTDSDNTAAEMAMFFLLKSNEHMATLVHLSATNCHRDAAIIARTMVEGAACLNWALLDVPTRTDKWFWFTLIHEWRTLQANQARGIPYDSEHLVRVAAEMEARGIGYIKRNLERDIQTAKASGKIKVYPGDPWAHEWTQMSIIGMIELLDENDSLVHFFRSSSQWVHWVSPPMFRALKSDQDFRVFDGEAWTELAASMIAAVSAYGQILVLVCRTLVLDHQSEVEQVLNDLHASLRKTFLPLTLDFET